MSKPMRRFVKAASRKNSVNGEEVDRIPGTTKIRTWCAANLSFYSDSEELLSPKQKTTGENAPAF